LTRENKEEATCRSNLWYFQVASLDCQGRGQIAQIAVNTVQMSANLLAWATVPYNQKLEIPMSHKWEFNNIRFLLAALTSKQNQLFDASQILTIEIPFIHSFF
jgi:hypothetical protein